MENVGFNKVLNEKYYLLREIAQKYNYSEELLNMITYIYISFYMDFGKSCDYPLFDLFNKVRIFYGEGTVNDVALRNGFDSVPKEAAAITIFEPNLDVFKNPDLKQNPQTIVMGTHVGEHLATPAFKLEMLIHEVRHALMGYYNTNILLDQDTYYMRSGLKEVYYYRDGSFNGKITSKSIGTILDEITNSYITSLLVNRVMSFKRYNIENEKLRSYLNPIRTSQPDGLYRPLGYDLEIRLLYPLLRNEMFIDLINQHQFDGEIDIIKDFIENSTDICSYQELCSLLDTIYSGNSRYAAEVQNNNFAFVQEHIGNIETAKTIVLDIESKIFSKKR